VKVIQIILQLNLILQKLMPMNPLVKALTGIWDPLVRFTVRMKSWVQTQSLMKEHLAIETQLNKSFLKVHGWLEVFILILWVFREKRSYEMVKFSLGVVLFNNALTLRLWAYTPLEFFELEAQAHSRPFAFTSFDNLAPLCCESSRSTAFSIASCFSSAGICLL